MPDAQVFADIHQLLADFFGCVDGNHLGGAAECFAPDGTWHRMGTDLTGREAILAALNERPADRITLHLFSNLRLLDHDADSATYTYGLIVHVTRTEDGSPRPGTMTMSVMKGRDTATRTEDGWHFARREANLIYRVDVG